MFFVHWIKDISSQELLSWKESLNTREEICSHEKEEQSPPSSFFHPDDDDEDNDYDNDEGDDGDNRSYLFVQIGSTPASSHVAMIG